MVAEVALPAGSRNIQSREPIRVGSFSDSTMGFHGAVASAVVLGSLITQEQLDYVYTVRGVTACCVFAGCALSLQ